VFNSWNIKSISERSSSAGRKGFVRINLTLAYCLPLATEGVEAMSQTGEMKA